ncbi:MAG: hypothetical protein ABI565_11375 [Vicinamibacteria bacterium]
MMSAAVAFQMNEPSALVEGLTTQVAIGLVPIHRPRHEATTR